MDITPVQSEWGLRDVNTTPIQAKNILRRTPLHTLRCVYILDAPPRVGDGHGAICEYSVTFLTCTRFAAPDVGR